MTQPQIADDANQPDPFRDGVLADASAMLSEILGSVQGAKAGASVAMAFMALAKTNPKMRQCTPESVRTCIAMCALTGLMPGGGLPSVHVIPRERWTKDANGKWGAVYELNFQIGVRGLITLAHRAGYQICGYPVYEGAPVQLDDRDRLIIPTTRRTVKREWDLLIGVIVTVHRMEDGRSLGRFFVETDLIEARRNASDSWIKGNETKHTRGYDKGKDKTEDEIAKDRRSPWFEWPEEMALKTALIYVVRRGYVPVDDVSEQVLRADVESDRVVIDASSTVVETRPTGKQALLPERLEGTDFRKEADKLAGRERVVVEGDAKQEGAKEGPKTDTDTRSAAERFRANVVEKLKLDADLVFRWMEHEKIEFDKLDEAGIKLLWTSIGPRGGKRNALNAFLEVAAAAKGETKANGADPGPTDEDVP